MPGQNLSTHGPPVRRAQPRYLGAFCTNLAVRLQSGSHLMLHGPRGSGKSTLLASMLDYYRLRSIPCALAPQTLGLADVVSALSQAYPATDLEGLDRRAIGARLRRAADRVPGVLLLDHTRDVTTAMIGFLRHLRGGIVGALLVVDIDSEFEGERLLAWRRHASRVRMPLMPNRRLSRLLRSGWAARGLPEIDGKTVQEIVRAARGRVGWLRECVRRLEMPEYWRDGRLRVSALCIDSEIAIRLNPTGPRMRAHFRHPQSFYLDVETTQMSNRRARERRARGTTP
jgi:energy-coupling factor transporter ATP-binding protein EcfA2